MGNQLTPRPIFDTDEQTRKRMRSVRTADTSTEIIVRKLIHALGFRFRLHNKNLPGNPDIVLARYRTVVMVHGCFWHGHRECHKGRQTPSRNVSFWQGKIKYNVEKDDRITEARRSLGWRVIVIWECETKNRDQLTNRLEEELRQRDSNK